MIQLTAEVIAIGDEMTSGARLDTNTQWLCQRLGELGVPVRFTSIVGDELADNLNVFQQAIRRSDIVIASGGLGPTADDLTREVLARVANVPLVLHEPSLRHIESLFASRAREMPERNRVQAYLPDGALDIFNPRGTAPGVDLTIPCADGRSSRVFALPGVPAEMKEMFHAVVAPRIINALGPDRPVIRHAIVRCFGLGESDMEARLGDMISRQHSPRVGITVSAATISLRITATASDEAGCQQQIDSQKQEIQQKVGQYVFGEGEDYELQHAVADRLVMRGERLASIEVGCGSLLPQWFADIPGSASYAGGLFLRVGKDEGGEDAAGQAEAPVAAIEQAFAIYKPDWLLIVEGYPSLLIPTEQAAAIKITLLDRQRVPVATSTQTIGGHPSIVHPRIAKTALAMVRDFLIQLPLEHHDRLCQETSR